MASAASLIDSTMDDIGMSFVQVLKMLLGLTKSDDEESPQSSLRGGDVVLLGWTLNQISKLKSVLYALPKVPTVFFASLLSIFVPQWCSATPGPGVAPYRVAMGSGECTFDENVNPAYLTTFNIGVVMFNFATLGVLLASIIMVQQVAEGHARRGAYLARLLRYAPLALAVNSVVPSDAPALLLPSSASGL